MQKWLSLALQGSLAISLVTLVGQSILTKINFKNQRRFLIAALVLAVLLGLFAFYFWLTTLATKQMFDAQAGIAVSLTSLTLLAFFWLPIERFKKASHFLGWLTIVALAVLTWIFTLDIVPYFQNVLATNTAFITTSMIIRLSLGLVAILLTVVLTLALSWLLASLLTSRLLFFKLVATPGLLAICLLGLTTALQMLLVLGRLPATPFIFNFVSWLINQAKVWFYFIFVSLALVALLALTQKPPAGEVKNTAEARKIKAGYRRERRWSLLATTVATLIISFSFISQTVASREIQLSPAKELKLTNGYLELALKDVKDKNLHRFSFTTSRGQKVRFLVVYKGAGLFGTAFDACELCGQAGYYQQGTQIICKNCNSVINKATLGFPGGCNPIPLASKIKKGKLLIKVKNVEAKAGVFK